MNMYFASGANLSRRQVFTHSELLKCQCPSYGQVGHDNLVKPVKGPLIYKAAAQQDDLALIGIES
jgi:hypothetical protein